jgi:YVTN family beta-propeller protein
MRVRYTSFLGVVILLLISCAVRQKTGEPHIVSGESSPISLAITRDGSTVYTAEYDAYRISAIDTRNGRRLRTYAVEKKPTGVVLSNDENKLYVTSGGENGCLTLYSRTSGEILKQVPMGHTPLSPVLDPAGVYLYIANRFSNSLSVIDCRTNTLFETIPMLREPVAVAVTPDGKWVFVANHLPSTHQIDQYLTDGGWMDIKGYVHGTDYSVSSEVMMLNTATMRIEYMVHLPNGSTGLRGICISPDGNYAYITHILARYHLPTTQLDRGWMNTNAVSIIDIQTKTLSATFLLDDIDRGAANPWGISCTPDGGKLIVAHAGTHEISIIDRNALHRKLTEAARGSRISDVPLDLGFLNGIRTRIALSGNGPRALAVTDSLIIAGEYFSNSLALCDISSKGMAKIEAIPLNEQHMSDTIRLGEKYFNDGTFCFQGWQSCASCHPDARADGLNWDLLNDGIGNPKNTKSLLYSHRTPPVMITGIRDRAETAVRAGMKFIQFTEHQEQDAQALDAYLSSLEPIPSPYLSDPDIRRNMKEGERIFRESGCAVCHPAPLFTDLRSYDVASGSGRELNRAFDTPTLVEIWRTYPYLYDGRAKTLEELLRTYNEKDTHGTTSKLTDKEMNELICYLLTL